MNTKATAGVDISASSPSTTFSTNGPVSSSASSFDVAEDFPMIPLLARPEYVPVVTHIVNANVIPNLRVLLASALGAIDAAIPNKDQNRAVRHIVRTQFDAAYADILQRAYPTCQFGWESCYAVEPELSRSKAFSGLTVSAGSPSK